MDAIGIVSSGGPQMIVNDGYLICSDLRQGLSEEAVAEMSWHNSISNQGLALGITLEQARGEVVAASMDLCHVGMMA